LVKFKYPEYLVCGKNVTGKHFKIIKYTSTKTDAIKTAKRYENKYDIVIVFKEVWKSQKIG